MSTIVFVAPYLMEATARFVRAAARQPDLDVAVVTHEPATAIPADLRELLAGHWQVRDALDPEQLAPAVAGLARQLGRVDRIVAALEQLQETLAAVREELGITGMDRETARNFRDKSRMKEVFQSAGVPCARHGLAGSAAEARSFASSVGFPLVVKPPAGAGAKATFRLDGPDALEAWLRVDAPVPGRPVLLEEFLVGQEFSFDSVTIDGEVVWHSISRYLPTPLEVLRNPWMQWVVVLPRDIDGPEFAGIRVAGPAALRALGLRTGLTHMEWFARPDGSVAISEVAARPPGAQITSLMSYAYEIDLYERWVRLLALDEFDPAPRRWAVGAAYLRGQHTGTAQPGSRVVAVHGLEDVDREIGELVVEARLPRPGQPPSSGYEGDGYVIVRHRDTEVVTEALGRIVSSLRVELG